ncbi:hypothetical protein ACYTFC_28865 [Streptomyces globosus]
MGDVQADSATATARLKALFAWGCHGGVRMGGGTVSALAAGAVDAATGTAVAVVKAASGP